MFVSLHLKRKKMKKNLIISLLAMVLMPFGAYAQKVDPLAYYADENGFEKSTTSISEGQAPLAVTFRSNPTNMDGYSPSYEWHFRKMDKSEASGGGYQELFVRYEEDTDYTFMESGTYNVVQKTRLEQDGTELDSVTITITILDSYLDYPNALSPNGDGWNDTFAPKKGWRSIVKFHGMILNRWGQKIFEWHDPAVEWDGKYNGKTVKDGVYFLNVEATGADGHEYHIRKDINVLSRSLGEGSSSSTTP